MKKLLNTLYVTSEGAWLNKDGSNVVVRIDGAERGRAPAHLLGQIVCFGRVGMSPDLMHFCAEEGISITFLSAYGRFLGRVEGPTSGNVLLRRAQHEATRGGPPGQGDRASSTRLRAWWRASVCRDRAGPGPECCAGRRCGRQ